MRSVGDRQRSNFPKSGNAFLTAGLTHAEVICEEKMVICVFKELPDSCPIRNKAMTGRFEEAEVVATSRGHLSDTSADGVPLTRSRIQRDTTVEIFAP